MISWRAVLASIAFVGIAACGQAQPVVRRVADAPPEVPDAAASEVLDAGSSVDATVDVATIEASVAVDAALPPQSHCELFTLRSDAASTCRVDADCAMTFTTCCGPCGQATLRDVAPISKARLAKGNPFCTSQSSCPDCEVKEPPNVKPACVDGVCVLGRKQCPNVGACQQSRPSKLLPQVQPASVAACGPATTCVVTYSGCCAPCTMLGEQQAIAVSSKALGKLREPCGGGALGLGHATTCPQCAAGPRNATLVADCVDGLCRVRDLGLDPVCAGWVPMRE